MTENDYKYRQGRSKRQQESNEMIAAWGFGGMVVLMIGLILYNLVTTF